MNGRKATIYLSAYFAAVLCAIGAVSLDINTAHAADKSVKKAKKVSSGTTTVISRETIIDAPDGVTPIETIRQELRTGKTAVLARLMHFKSAEQAAAFWPVYRQYQADLASINDRRLAIINDYLTSYRDLGDSTASSLMKRTLAEQMEMVKLRQKYADTMSSKVSPVVAASFLQIEGVLQSIMELEVKSNLPLLAEQIEAINKTQITAAAK